MDQAMKQQYIVLQCVILSFNDGRLVPRRSRWNAIFTTLLLRFLQVFMNLSN